MNELDTVKKKKKKKKSRKARQMKQKLISIIVAVVLIVIVAIIAFGGSIKRSIENGEEFNARFFLALIYPDKYAYSSEEMDMNEYYQLFAADEIGIVLQDEIIPNKGKLIDGVVYFDLDTVSSLFTRRFYYNETEATLLYTTSTEVRKVNLSGSEKGYYIGDSFTQTEYVPALVNNSTVYVAADYVKLYANFSYAFFQDPNRMQIYTKWNTRKEAELVKNTKVRYQGGIKSDILTSVSKGDKVTVLEIMENWVKVKTTDGFIGYLEKNKINDYVEVNDEPVTGAYSPKADYLANEPEKNIVIGWHQIFFADDGSNLNEVLRTNTYINVVSPTWFYTNSSTGTFDNYSNAAYVTNAHNKGLKVWALCEDMTNTFDEYELFSSSANRKTFIDNLISSTTAVGADGINMDFEKIGKETGPHYVQFLRELAIETRKNGLILSVDNYQQNQGNLYYNLGEQGLVADYVIIMNYDEHWAGCSEAGSVASIDFVERGLTSAIEAGVPAGKLINGVPFYTRLWREEGDNITSSALSMDTASEWVSNKGLTAAWDETTCQYYVTSKDGTAIYEMWMEDTKSIETKLTICDNHEIAGIACWRLGLDNNDVWTTIKSHYGN